MLKKTLLALAFTSLAVAAFAQQTGIKRTPLQKVEFPDGYNTVTAIAEVPAGGAAGRHTHPGVETGYVLEGELNLPRSTASRRKPSKPVIPTRSRQASCTTPRLMATRP